VKLILLRQHQLFPTGMKRRARQSTEDTYARITREHFEQDRKKKQEHLIGQLKRLLRFFDETFVKNPSEREPNHRDWPFIWPKEEDFAELDDLVFRLARSLRKKKKLPHEEAYSLVDERWPSLRLDKFFYDSQSAYLDSGSIPRHLTQLTNI
jgi:hypothetical protein